MHSTMLWMALLAVLGAATPQLMDVMREHRTLPTPPLATLFDGHQRVLHYSTAVEFRPSAHEQFRAPLEAAVRESLVTLTVPTQDTNEQAALVLQWWLHAQQAHDMFWALASTPVLQEEVLSTCPVVVFKLTCGMVTAAQQLLLVLKERQDWNDAAFREAWDRLDKSMVHEDLTRETLLSWEPVNSECGAFAPTRHAWTLARTFRSHWKVSQWWADADETAQREAAWMANLLPNLLDPLGTPKQAQETVFETCYYVLPDAQGKVPHTEALRAMEQYANEHDPTHQSAYTQWLMHKHLKGVPTRPKTTIGVSNAM